MFHPEYIDEIMKELANEALAIRWFIYQNGGNATKTAVEDVLMLRHDNVDRGLAHDIMNMIEYHQMDMGILQGKVWRGKGQEPTTANYPEIGHAKIKWYDGDPFLVKG